MKEDSTNKNKLCNKTKAKPQEKFNIINISPAEDNKKKKDIEKGLFNIFKKYS